MTQVKLRWMTHVHVRHSATRRTTEYICVCLAPGCSVFTQPKKGSVCPNQVPAADRRNNPKGHQSNARSATCACEPSSNSWTEMSVPPTTHERRTNEVDAATMPIACGPRRIQVVIRTPIPFRRWCACAYVFFLGFCPFADVHSFRFH